MSADIRTMASPPSSSLLTASKVLAMIRIGVGAASFLAPQLTCASHGYHVPAPYALLVRMMGHREAINGGLLLAAANSDVKEVGTRKGIRWALLVGLVADSLDICAVLYGFSRGEVESMTAGILGTAAAGAISVATIMLRAL
ncbi:hypothetical protein Micbo1qcDRAFT_199000 [Microdochium bolleyi]|uniref:Uncharacterized protein n=1 Tax=Microdochium bolleyi TaxID=196109 RepID=A0A136IJB2_9PEZI|nr:hypothetical protein Micbo1qcDRAFT_199000 [Microdochium bolleyi]